MIGTYEAPDSTFVRHVALLREEGRAAFGSQVHVFHMGPPLVVGAQTLSRTTPAPTCPCHVAGMLSLTADERDGILDWLAEVDKEDRPEGVMRMWQTYTVDPPEIWQEDERGVRLYGRFSCGGFVLACYRDGAGILLIDVANARDWPAVTIDEIARAYGPRVRDMETLRRRLGIPGDGPWPVLLAGYVVHAFNRADQEIRNSAMTAFGPTLARFG